MANFSIRCNYCRQLINLKTEQVREAVQEVEAKHETFYDLHCPKCRRLVKIPLRDLKKKLPVEAAAPPQGEAEHADGDHAAGE